MNSIRAEQQLILISAGTAARRSAMQESAGHLASEIDWRRLAATLRVRRLLPTLGPRIVEITAGRESEEFVAAVAEAITVARRQGALLALLTERVVAMLGAAGIRSSALKGPLFSEAIYNDPGRRLASDIDLLVARQDLPAAVRVVRGLGYSAPTDYTDAAGLPLLHCALSHEKAELPPVELHWRIHWYEGAFAGERLLPGPTDPPGAWHPHPADQLVALLLFYARDGFLDLRLATDVGAWWDRYGAQLEQTAFRERIDAYPKLRRALLAAVAAAERTVGLPRVKITGDTGTADLGVRAAVRLADPNPRGSASQIHADMGLVDGLLTPRGGFGEFWRRQVLLPQEVLEDRRRRGNRPMRSRTGHGIRVLVRYGLAMKRLVRPAEATPLR